MGHPLSITQVTTNTEIAGLLHDLAVLTRLSDGSSQSYRARAYDGAARTVESLSHPIENMSQAEMIGLKGIGKSTAAKITEFVETGRIRKLSELQGRYPPEFLELVAVPGIGPKTGKLLRERLGVETVDDLKLALDRQELRELPGLGAKTEEKIAGAIERLGMAGKERRTPIIQAMALAGRVIAELQALREVERIQYSGSLRRFSETIGDVDILVAAERSEPIMDRFTELAVVRDVLAHGVTKSSVLTQSGLQVDLRVVEPDQYGAALVYFTGSKDHNISLRQRAIERGLLLNEYGLFDSETEEVLVSRTEEEIYAGLGLPFIPPPLREDSGEIEAAQRGDLPDLVFEEDIRGDLHVHSSLSGDGDDTLEDMIARAAERGYEYLAITDHAEDLTINGATRQEMLAERRQLRVLQERYPDMTLLHGSELNIGPDGSLDYDREFLLGFDYCVASVHSHFDLDAEQQTIRLIEALRHPAVNAIGHLQGRRIGKRPPIEIDLEAVIEAAELTGTAIEINSHLDRLDASADVLRMASEADVRFVIDTDSHRISELAQIRWGILNSQRGWVPKEKVANTWPGGVFLEWVASKRQS